MTRRGWLAGTLAVPWLAASRPSLAADQPLVPRRVAAVATVYQKGTHADVLLGKILEGWKHDGGPGPALTLAGMYVDQFPAGDLARDLSAKHNFPLFGRIEEALTLGTGRIAVDGVISIGEHGDYPFNDKGQQLYPRRRFFEEITAAFERYGRVVPVFSDKHLGPVWSDARWMYDRARQLGVPLLAGSSLPVGFRQPEADVPPGCRMESVVAVGYSGLDIYGIHALEFLQCHAERRAGAETGVRSVQCLEGADLWQAVDTGRVPAPPLEAALAVLPRSTGNPRDGKRSALFLFDYVDGLCGAVLMLPDYARGTAVGVQIRGENQAQAACFDERTEPRYPHFAYLLKAIERMVHTGRPSYPVERTLLTGGLLDRALTSRAEGHARLETPELAIAYQPVDYPHAPLPELDADPRAAP